MYDTKTGAQRAPLPKRKCIRLPREAYANPASTFNITIDALERRRYFAVRTFNDEVVAILRRLAVMYGTPIRIYCLMPTHLHMLINPGVRSLIDVIAEFKKETGDLARETRRIEDLWQRSFYQSRQPQRETPMDKDSQRTAL